MLEEPELATRLVRAVHARDDLLDMLEAEEPDVIYLYCHARSAGEGVFEPHLELCAKGKSPGRITAGDIAGKRWAHAPLVLLNGCSSVAFSPSAPSPFIQCLVRDRRASGVIGTEVTVWEALAGEMALRFLRHFLAGTPAGHALLNARWELLAKHNPLGLVYTLYAPAELKLARRAPS